MRAASAWAGVGVGVGVAGNVGAVVSAASAWKDESNTDKQNSAGENLFIQNPFLVTWKINAVDCPSDVFQVTDSDIRVSECRRLSRRGMQPDSSTTKLIHAPVPV